MDIKAEVAARRAELERRQKLDRAEEVAAEVERKAEAERQANIAREAVATRLSTEEVEIVRVGDHLEIVQPATPSTIDTAGLLEKEVEALARTEVRKMWTPSDSWKVIGVGSAGAGLLISIPYIGVPMLGYAFWQRVVISKRYLRVIKQSHPSLFGSVPENIFKI